MENTAKIRRQVIDLMQQYSNQLSIDAPSFITWLENDPEIYRIIPDLEPARDVFQIDLAKIDSEDDLLRAVGIGMLRRRFPNEDHIWHSYDNDLDRTWERLIAGHQWSPPKHTRVAVDKETYGITIRISIGAQLRRLFNRKKWRDPGY